LPNAHLHPLSHQLRKQLLYTKEEHYQTMTTSHILTETRFDIKLVYS
jgi:hypothetical protein